jgi:hypothetical protein
LQRLDTAQISIRAVQLIDTVSRLIANKNDGSEVLSINHFKYASVELALHNSFLFSSILVPGSIPEDFLKCTAISISKSKNVIVTDSKNEKKNEKMMVV